MRTGFTPHRDGLRPAEPPVLVPGPGSVSLPRETAARLGNGGAEPLHLRALGLGPIWELSKQQEGETEPTPACGSGVQAASLSVLLAWVPKIGDRAREARGTPPPSPLTAPSVACCDPGLTRAAGVAGRPQDKPNLPGAALKQAPCLGLDEDLYARVARFVPASALSSAAPGRPGAEGANGSGPARGGRRRGARRPPAFSCLLRRALRLGSLCRPVPPQPQVSF